MRNRIIMMLVVGLCACFSGCADDASQSQARNNEASQKQFYDNPIVLTRLREGVTDEREQTLEVIDSWEDWTALSDKIVEEDSDYVNYDKEFFKEKDLLLIKFIAECDNRYTFDKMELEERQLNKKLTISMTEKAKSCSGCYQPSLLFLCKTGMLAEVDKGSVPEDVIWHLDMKVGTYYKKLGYIKGMQSLKEGLTLEFDEAQWTADEETQPDARQLVSKGEPATVYAVGEWVRYIISSEGVENYNQSHEKKLKAAASETEEIVLDEAEFMKYIEFLNQTYSKQDIGFWVTIDDDEVVSVEAIL